VVGFDTGGTGTAHKGVRRPRSKVSSLQGLEPCNSLKCLVIRCNNALAAIYSTEAAITDLRASPNPEIMTLLFHIIIQFRIDKSTVLCEISVLN
jgi:hypothetical protein